MGGEVSKAPDVPQRALLDTSVVIAGDVAPIPGVVAISAITLAELQFGVLVAKTAPVRAERLREIAPAPQPHGRLRRPGPNVQGRFASGIRRGRACMQCQQPLAVT